MAERGLKHCNTTETLDKLFARTYSVNSGRASTLVLKNRQEYCVRRKSYVEIIDSWYRLYIQLSLLEGCKVSKLMLLLL